MSDRYPYRNTSEDIANGAPPLYETPLGAQKKADAAREAAEDVADKALQSHRSQGGNEHPVATDLSSGFMSGPDKSKLDSVLNGAEPNQNAFSSVNNLTAKNEQDSLNVVGLTGIDVTTNPMTNTLSITATGTATPGKHASSHLPSGSDPIPIATDTEGGLLSAADFKQIKSNKASSEKILANSQDAYINIKDFGALCNGTNDDTTAVQNAVNFAKSKGGGIVLLPEKTTFNAGNVTYYEDVFIFDLSQKGININDYVSSPNPTMILRRNAQFNGGTPGFTNSAMTTYTTVGKNVTSFEWGITSCLYNSADAGENTSIYGKSVKYSTGPTFAGVFEARDGTGNSTSGALIGLEVDVFCNGSDTGSRVGIDIVVGKGVDANASGVASVGLRIGPQNGDNRNGSFATGILTAGNFTNAINIGGGSVRGITLTGSFAVGIDTSSGTFSSEAIRMGANQKFSFESTGSIYMSYNSSNGYIEFFRSGNRVGFIKTLGPDHEL
ncbi:hypothetical protein ACFSGI_09025 [Paenibacillus nicotianae]|uniref:Pectate lyase superfamily protein n=1 Tax=Paenibacillus nicotianae TaxID=1526551 RepID=A0ABW4USZ7_9BACL